MNETNFIGIAGICPQCGAPIYGPERLVDRGIGNHHMSGDIIAYMCHCRNRGKDTQIGSIFGGELVASVFMVIVLIIVLCLTGKI